MARVTVEDCVEKVADRFELVALAAQRAKDIAAGAPLKIERNHEKNTVLSLREIAADLVDPEDLRENIIKHHQREYVRSNVSHDEMEGTEVSAEELENEEFELKELEGEEQEKSSFEDIGEEIAEIQAAAEVVEELEQADGISFEEDNLEDLED